MKINIKTKHDVLTNIFLTTYLMGSKWIKISHSTYHDADMWLIFIQSDSRIQIFYDSDSHFEPTRADSDSNYQI